MNPPENTGFNMSVFRGDMVDDLAPDMSPKEHTCGTAMCIAGWMNALESSDGGFDNASIYKRMGVSQEAACALDRLFFGGDALNTPLADMTAEQAVRAIDQFIETDGAKAWAGIA